MLVFLVTTKSDLLEKFASLNIKFNFGGSSDIKFKCYIRFNVSGGGTNEECNLQVLCPSCHRDKCSSEHEQGQYIKPKETASFFNSEVRDIMNSDLAQQHAFVEKAYYDEVDINKKLFCIDINKCRRNILKYSNFIERTKNQNLIDNIYIKEVAYFVNILMNYFNNIYNDALFIRILNKEINRSNGIKKILDLYLFLFRTLSSTYKKNIEYEFNWNIKDINNAEYLNNLFKFDLNCLNNPNTCEDVHSIFINWTLKEKDGTWTIYDSSNLICISIVYPLYNKKERIQIYILST
jgi:hypothetical protein